ncbi:hypothetical protein ABTW96_13370 [Nocardia beijingensis]|uniref:hypothetical protein n=1 Tax=Nocardia beijingensis TaxID=95162 RepID=UPI0033256EDF
MIHFDFANVAELFDRNDGKIWEMVGRWDTLAKIWNSSVQTFGMNLQPTFKENHWQGAGADKAAAYLESHLKSAADLQDAMDAMAEVLAATGDFNLYSWETCPDTASSTTPEKKSKTSTTGKPPKHSPVSRWEGKESGGAKGYVDGFRQLAAMIPLFADPITRTGGTGGNDTTSSKSTCDPG